MRKEILTSAQKKFLELFARQPALANHFVLSGGTALAGFHLFHRLSDDLDFFSREEFDPQQIFPYLKTFLKPLSFKKIEYQQSFNRNLYFFVKKGQILKTEFTYFPFEPIAKALRLKGIFVESLKDIAINKVFTIYQKPRMRDFIDLYSILQEEKWPLGTLLKLARIKFDTHIDALQWGSQLIKVKILKDFPRMAKKINYNSMMDFFIRESRKAGEGFLKNN